MEPFDITAPLPTGTTLLEASAGTGKTWTIAALVTRYVACGEAKIDELLVVTGSAASSTRPRRSSQLRARQIPTTPCTVGSWTLRRRSWRPEQCSSQTP